MADSVVDPVGVGTIVAGTYEVTQFIGRGGSGAVWAARHLRLPGKQVAIKVLLATGDLDSEVYARFRREAEIVSQLGHPNIVEVFDFNNLPNGTPYIVLELLRGESLGDRLRRGPIGLEAALDIVRQIGSALNAAHKQQVIHRDLKPANIFLCPSSNEPPRDHVKVLDFGISKICGSDTVHTQANVLMGTPRYMSPEQAQGKNDRVDQRTDEFALAAILYEMLTGRPVFPGEGLTEILMQVVHETPKPLREVMPGLPPHITAAIDRALEKDPGKRFADVAGFVSALTGTRLEAFEPPIATQSGTNRKEAAVDAGNQALAESRRYENSPSPTDEDRVPAGILFGDMKGSTEEAESDEKSTVGKLREYERIVHDTAKGFGPSFYKVKSEGDGFMATFATAHAVVACGFAVQQEFRRRGWQVRLGGHYGEVFRNESGDAFGADVNRAARIMSAADASCGQFLVSDTVKDIVRSRLSTVRLEPRPPIAAKGVGQLTVYEVVPTGTQPPAEASISDPTAELEVTPGSGDESASGLLTPKRFVAAAVASTAVAAIILMLHPPSPFANVSRRTSALAPGTVAHALLQLGPQRAELKVSAKVLTPESTKIGDPIRLRIGCDRDCYAIVFAVGTTSKVTALVPNALQRFNFIKEGEYMVIPTESYELRTHGPPGIERFKVIASAEPLATLAAGVEDLDLASVDRLRSALGPKPWGEQVVEVKVE